MHIIIIKLLVLPNGYLEVNDQRKKTERTDNSMTKGKRQKNRQFNDQRKKTEEQTIQ
jgi:hypothetical protein